MFSELVKECRIHVVQAFTEGHARNNFVVGLNDITKMACREIKVVVNDSSSTLINTNKATSYLGYERTKCQRFGA